MLKRIYGILRLIEPEAYIWLAALILLAISDPYSKTHYTLFLPALFFDIPSPGYNLGHSIAFLFHGQLNASLNAHPLGIVAVLILARRTWQLIKKSFQQTQTQIKEVR